MPRTFFTSDTHFGHVKILEYNAAQRPFEDTDHMDEEIIRRWNAVVAPEDTVYHLGDIALGQIDKSLAKVARLNGNKIAILGNHDKPFMFRGKAKEEEWWARYREVFQHVLDWNEHFITVNGMDFVVSHFPYQGDSHDGDRYEEMRPTDNGTPLIHGHTHKTGRVSFSKNGTRQIHVGMDAWDLTPVSAETIIELTLAHGESRTLDSTPLSSV